MTRLGEFFNGLMNQGGTAFEGPCLFITFVIPDRREFSELSSALIGNPEPSNQTRAFFEPKRRKNARI